MTKHRSTPQESLRLDPGDRVPNFVLPNHRGKFHAFYGLTLGDPLMLIVYQSNADPVVLRELETVASLHPRIKECSADIMVINQESAANNTKLSQRFTCFDDILSDPKCMITGAIAQAVVAGWRGTDQGNLPTFAMVLDDNQRVLAALQPGTRPLAEQALDILAHHPREEGYEIREVAPVQIVQNVLAPGLCQRLIKLWQSGGHEEGLVYRVDSGRNVHSVDFEQKRRLDHVIRDKSMIDLLSRLIGPRVADEAFKAHYFRDFRFEQFVIGAYDAERQDFFRRHRDNLGGKTAQRRFAISINLNPTSATWGSRRC